MDANDKTQLEIECLEERMMLSSVQIYAAGDTGTESFELLVKDQVVATFDNVGGDFANRDFVQFEFQTPQEFTGGDVTIRFINDDYRPEVGFDSNLHVSRIVVDGVVHETESPSTFSTGYWADGGFTGPGFFETETLNTNGSFSYANEGAASGTRIKVDARGTTGDEVMQIRVDGNVVKEFQVGTETGIFVFQSDTILSADQIEVAFVNDQYDPAQGIDRNLTIERLRLVDRSTAETVTFFADSSDTFSTGTWTAPDGIAPGFGRGNTLHTNGYFRFAAPTEPPSELVDTSFGTDGFATFNQRGSTPDISISGNGQIVTGSSTGTGRDSGFTEIHLFNADGDRVSSFANNGYLRLELPSLESITVLNDGSLIVANRFRQSGRIEVRRITALGDVDTGFGSGGVVSIENISNPYAQATPDGGFLFAATLRAEPGAPSVLQKFDSSGNRDFSYGLNGTSTLPEGFVVDEIKFNNWGAAVLSGFEKIAQVTPAGWLDQGFGNGGIVDSPVLAGGLEIDSQNRILVSGRSLSNGTPDGLIRFTSSGQVDTSFQQGTLAQGRDGFFVAGDYTVDSSNRVLGTFLTSVDLGNGTREYTRSVYRLNESGQFDASFGDNGIIVESVKVTSESFQEFRLTFHSIELNQSGQAVVATIDGLSRFTL